MEKFDLLVKQAVENAEMPIPMDAWKEFQTKRGGVSNNTAIVGGGFFLTKFAAAGVGLLVSLFAINGSSDHSTTSSTSHHSEIFEAANPHSGHATSSQSTNSAETESSIRITAHSEQGLESTSSERNALVAETILQAENSYVIVSERLSNADKLNPALTERNDVTLAQSNLLSDSEISSVNLELDNLTAEEKSTVLRLNKRLQEAADRAKANRRPSESESIELDKNSTTVYKGDSFDLGAPRVFTPNSDGMNDTFIPVMLKSGDDFVMTVKDDTGRELFRTKSVTSPWDGTSKSGIEQPEGKYRWAVTLMKDNKKSIFKGEIKLVRH